MSAQPARSSTSAATTLPAWAAVWDETTIKRFWNHHYSRPHLTDDCFSKEVGAGIVHLAKLSGKLQGRVLDYGCGMGFLLDHILPAGQETYGCDFSTKAVEGVNARFDGQTGWRGAVAVQSLPLPLASNMFDFIFLIETIEHLPDAWLQQTLAELHRLLKPGGCALITTPHDEPIEKHLTYCPFCQKEFHPVQHMRTFTIPTLSQELATAGFQVDDCRNVDFRKLQRIEWFPELPDISPRRLWNYFRFRTARKLDQWFPRPYPQQRLMQLLGAPGPHLYALARKPG